jgi:hypothetical protein
VDLTPSNDQMMHAFVKMFGNWVLITPAYHLTQLGELIANFSVVECMCVSTLIPGVTIYRVYSSSGGTVKSIPKTFKEDQAVERKQNGGWSGEN